MTTAFSCEFRPVQTEAGVAVTEAIAGGSNTVTFTVDVELQPLRVDTKVYTPLLADVAAGMLGFWSVLVKPFGPVHWKLVPMSVPPVRAIGAPLQAALAEAVAVGCGRPSMSTLADAVPPQASVIVTDQVPAMLAFTV